ncbi:unnamed protein product [Cuscuta campestris]|uniref:F-box domain-containing protein n=1 Tax=Cuscuta campestris TaxID=132261 RepID=A0A484N9B2_9ASTE|nr:unnamed protein product [Cuscuta campestris]
MAKTVKLDDDLVAEIISRLPFKLAIQCKLISKRFNSWISNPKFSQTLFQHDRKVWTLALPPTSFDVSRDLQKIFRDLIIIPHRLVQSKETCALYSVFVLAVCRGLLLLVFPGVGMFCVFNPITRAHQLIPYRGHYSLERLGDAGLFVDYPASDLYKLVTVEWLDEGKGYSFHVFSSSSKERFGLWRQVQIRMIPSSSKDIKPPPPAYVQDDSLHWLNSDIRVLAFDAKREEATFLDPPPEFVNHIRKYINPKGRRRRFR